jgi:hypothetical protein
MTEIPPVPVEALLPPQPRLWLQTLFCAVQENRIAHFFARKPLLPYTFEEVARPFISDCR